MNIFMRSVCHPESIEPSKIIFRKGLLKRKPTSSSSVKEDRVRNQVALEPIAVSILKSVTTNQTIN